MANVTFRRGTEANLPSSGMADEGCFFLAEDTGNLYVGDENGNLVPINRSPYYGTCPTEASTNSKVVTIDVNSDVFSLSEGAMISVRFANANTAASPTLNVNGSGAIAVKSYGTTSIGDTEDSSWHAGEVVTFIYDGTYWMFVGGMGNIQPDWEQDTDTADDYIKNKPRIKAGEASGSTIEGYFNSKALGIGSHAEGYYNAALGLASHVEGYGASFSSVLLNGSGTTYTVIGASVEVGDILTLKNNSTTYATVLSVSGLTITVDTSLGDGDLVAARLDSYALGRGSHVEGCMNVANNNYEHAEGQYNVSNSGSTDAEKTISSIGIGDGNGDRANAIEVMKNGDMYVFGVGDYDGTNTASASTLQTVIGNSANVQSDWEEDDDSLSSYIQNKPSIKAGIGADSINEGLIYGNYAIGDYSHAEGTDRVARGTNSHAEGGGSTRNITISSREFGGTSYSYGREDIPPKSGNIIRYQDLYASVIGVFKGYFTVSQTLGDLTDAIATVVTDGALGDYSHVEGLGTIANNVAEHAEGSYNFSNTKSGTISSIGIGGDDAHRLNAVEVLSNGQVYFKNIGGYDGTNSDGLETKSIRQVIEDIDSSIHSYTIESVSPDTGYLTAYQLKQDNVFVGAKINIPKDMVVSNGEVKTVTVADEPYVGAQVGDKYIDLTIANATTDHLYIPVKDLVDIYYAGNGLSLSGTTFSVVIDPNNANGLSVGASGVALATATTSLAGAMSAADKTKLDGIASGAEVNVQSDWNQTNDAADDFIKNKPSIPTATSDLTNDSGFITSSDIPVTDVTVGGTSVVSNCVAVIPAIPDSTSDLTNDSGFITSADVPTKTSDLTNDGEDGDSTYIENKDVLLENNAFIVGDSSAQGVLRRELANVGFTSDGKWKGSGQCRIRRVIGKGCVAFNQLTTRSTYAFTYGGVTYTPNPNSDGWILNGTCTAKTTNSQYRMNTVNVISGHKYFTKLEKDVSIGITNTGRGVYFFPGAGVIQTCTTSGYPYYLLSGKVGITYDNYEVHPVLVDLTKMFGAGNEPETAEEFMEMFPSHYPTNQNGTILGSKGNAIISVGYNLFDDYSSKALLNLGTYVIEGSYTSVDFQPLNGLESSVPTIDSDGKFDIAEDGTLTVIGGDTTTCIHRYADGISRDNLEYWNDECILNIESITGKSNGSSTSETLFQYGLLAIGDVYDEITADSDGVARTAIRRIGVRAHTSTDDGDTTVVTDGTRTSFVLEHEEVFVLDTPIDLKYKADGYGIEIHDTESQPSLPLCYDSEYRGGAVNAISTENDTCDIEDWRISDTDIEKWNSKQNLLLAGHDIDIQDIVEVEYLESTGTQWIDTGVIATENTRVKATLMTLSTGNKNWFGGSYTGTASTAKGFAFNSYNINKIEYLFGNTGWKIVNVSDIVGRIFTLDFSKDGIVIDGSTVEIPSYTTFSQQTAPIAIFVHVGGSAYINGRIYAFQIYQNGILVRDYIPIRVGTTGYMYDRVSGQLFGNDGTGSFVVGSDVRPLSLISFVNNDGYITSADISDKADKVSNATNGNFAGLDANGNLLDSGYSYSSFLASSTTIPTIIFRQW